MCRKKKNIQQIISLSASFIHDHPFSHSQTPPTHPPLYRNLFFRDKDSLLVDLVAL